MARMAMLISLACWSGLGCSNPPATAVVRLALRQLPSCELPSGGGTLRVRAHGDFPLHERLLDLGGPAVLDGFPWQTRWLELELESGPQSGGGLVALQGEALARDVLMLPFGRSCPLGDPAAAATFGAAVAPLPEGGLLIAGGSYGGSAASASAHWLAPGATLLQEVESGMLLRRSGASATRVDGRVVIAGGGADERGPAHDTFEVFVAGTQRFETGASGKLAGGPRRDHAAARLGDGRVLIAGGRSELESMPMAVVEILDPVTGRSELAGTLQVARVSPSLLVLDDGVVLVALGSDGSGRLRPEVERIDLDAASAEIVATLPLHAVAAVTALEGGRVAYLGCDENGGACELTCLLAPSSGFALAQGIDDATLSAAGLRGLTQLRLLALRDGKLFVTGRSPEASGARRGFVVDLDARAIEAADLSRVPDHLLELDDGTLAELDAFGASLTRRDLLTEFDDVPEPLAWDAALHVVLDAPERWQRSESGLLALQAARWDVPRLRFGDVRVEFTLDGDATLLLEPAARPPLELAIGESAIGLGGCQLTRAANRPLAFERRGAELVLRSGQVARSCPLPRALESVGLALRAQAGARIADLRITRLPRD